MNLRKLTLSIICVSLIVTGYKGLVRFSAAESLRSDETYEEYLDKGRTGEYRSEPASFIVEDGRDDPRELGENTPVAEWTVNVSEEGFYNIEIEYYPLPGKSKNIEFSISVNGSVPFDKAARITLPRIWKDEAEISRDPNGNDLRPRQVEAPRWVKAVLEDTEGHYNDPFLFRFVEGENTVRFTSTRENMAVSYLRVFRDEHIPVYKDIVNEYETEGYANADEFIGLIEAEKTKEKSSSLLYPMYDRSSPATSPSHFSKIRLNTIGQLNWKYQGQWITWEFEVPQDGLYEIDFKARQNYLQGLNCYRTLYIDDEIPFAEAKDIVFKYDLKWYNRKLEADGVPAKVYLTAGEKHTLTLKATPGPTAEILKDLNDAVLQLNTLYRKIIMVTGTSPDIYRSFYLESEIPGLLDDMSESRDMLVSISERVVALTGQSGTQASIVDQVIYMLNDLIEDPATIPERIARYKDNLESLGALILLLAEQPLELDYIVVSSETDVPAVEAGWTEKFIFNFRAFVASFVEDYNSIGKDYGSEAITVWVSGGRDQAQVIKSMIDDLFTPSSGIPVNLRLVDLGATLIQATLAGKGPDIAMLTPKETPVNLAMRGALTDLSKLEGFEDIKQRFFPSAFIPYEYQGGVYAIPETQNFDMLFYRKDILEELGLEIPQTWDDVYKVISTLQKNNLQFGLIETDAANVGLSAGIATFEKFLIQAGGSYYTEDLSRTAFDSDIANDAFRSWTELYTDYGLERSFNFYNRFRSGEMPIGIQPYPMYNMLTQAAPELRGLWDFAPIPGTRRDDGTIDRSETARGNGCIMLSGAKDEKAAFEYIKWWTGSEVQIRYGTELESIMGPSARYDTANIEAFKALPWTEHEADLLLGQWEHVTDIPQIPGNYFVSRSLTNAFRSVLDLKYEPARMLANYNRDINLEIARKREEFGLE